MFQLGELSTNRYFPNHSLYRLILTLGIAHLTLHSQKQWFGMLPCTHGWALGLCTVFKHISTSCGAVMKETKPPVYTLCSSYLEQALVPWQPVWHGLCSSGAHKPWPHCSALGTNLASYQPPLLSAAGAEPLLTLPTLMSECTFPRHGRWPHQHPPHKVTKPNKGVQRLLQKHTACFCSDHVCCHFFPSTRHQSHHRKPHALGCWQNQLKLGL